MERPIPFVRYGSRFILVVWLFTGWNGLPPNAHASEPPYPQATALTVADAVSEALAHNHELALARHEIPIARAEQVGAKLRLNPMLSLGADHLDALGTGYSRANNAGPQEFFVRTDVFFMGGPKRKRRIQHAELGQAIAEKQVDDAVRAITLQVQLACVEVQLARDHLALARENAALLERVVALNETRVAAGDLAKVELTRARIAKTGADDEVRLALASQKKANNNLRLALGRVSGSEILTIRDAYVADESLPPLPSLRRLALEQRPDYLAAEHELARSSADVRLQTAEGLVDFSVGVEVRRQEGLAGRGNSLGVFGAIPLPMWDRNQGEVERARQEERAQRTRLTALARAIANEIDNAYVDVQTARESVRVYESGVLEQADEVLATVEYAYSKGEASLLELMDAQRAHHESQRAYNEARAAYARSRFSLDAVMGRPR